jgi:hypothetical protein
VRADIRGHDTNMTTSIRLSAVVMGIAFAALTASAVPLGSPLGLPDRDVVRNPYGSFGGTFGSSVVPQNGNIIGPNVGFLAGITPPLFGGGGGGGAALGLSFGASVLFPTGSNGAGGSPIVLPPNGSGPSLSLPFIKPYTTQTTLAIAAQSVPDGGSSLILMGCGLLSLLALRRGMFRRKS